MNSNEKIRSKLLFIIDSDQFFVELNNVYIENINVVDSIGAELATIHNEGIIDIIAKFLTVKKSKGQDFVYNMLNIFDHILPTVNSSVPNVLKSLIYINLELNTDINKRLCTRGLSLYCDKQDGRPNQVLNYCLLNTDESANFIYVALISGAKNNLDVFINKAIEFTRNGNEFVQNNALLALGGIDYSNKTGLIDNILYAIEELLKSKGSDLLCQSAIETLINIYLKIKFSDSELTKLLKLALTQPSKETIFVVSTYFNFNVKNIPDSAIYVFLNVFSGMSSSNINQFKQIDYGLSNLLKANKEVILVDFLEDILTRSRGEISITLFTSLVNEIQKNNVFLNTLATRWFLSKNIVLASAIKDITEERYDKNIELLIDANLISDKNQDVYLFLAKKSCGWLFMSPISAVSFLLSLIDLAPKGEVQLINEIILNPMLFSYSGSVKKYLEHKLKNGSVAEKQSIKKILESFDEYQQGLKDAWSLQEMLPTLTQREAYQRKYNDDLNKAYKETDDDSFVTTFYGKPQILLYGSALISNMAGKNNSTQRQENRLAEVKTTFEFSSLSVLDPHSLDNKLNHYRTEGCIV